MEDEMDSLSKKIFKELETMQQQTGRMLWNMAITKMLPYESGKCWPLADVYEAEGELYVYFDLAGADCATLSVIADEQQVRISGRRELPAKKTIGCVHQLEIELGGFDRTISLPSPVDVSAVTSSYRNGILLITMPIKQHRKKVEVTVLSHESEMSS
jgi:HSP20 family protein